MNDIELNRRELTGDDALRFARESGMERASETRGLFLCGVGDLIRFARLVRQGWTPPSTAGVGGRDAAAQPVEDLGHLAQCVFQGMSQAQVDAVRERILALAPGVGPSSNDQQEKS